MLTDELRFYMRATLLARSGCANMESWPDEYLLGAFHCRDNPSYEAFAERMGWIAKEEKAVKPTRKAAKNESADAERLLMQARLLASIPGQQIVKVDFKPDKEPAKAQG